MSGLALHVDVDGAENLIRRLNRLDLNDTDMGKLLSTLGENVVTQTKERFRAEEGPDGKKWKISRRAREEGGQTLTDNTDLKNSIHRRVTGREVEIGTAKVYGAIHQFGGVIKPKNGKYLVFGPKSKKVFVKSVTMPARPFLGFSPANEKELLSEMNRFVARRMRM